MTVRRDKPTALRRWLAAVRRMSIRDVLATLAIAAMGITALVFVGIYVMAKVQSIK